MKALKIKIFFILIMAFTACKMPVSFAAQDQKAAQTQTKQESSKEETNSLESLSAYDFAKKTQGYAALKELSSADDEKTKEFWETHIQCQNQICDKATEKCIKGIANSAVANRDSREITSTVDINCLCVSKDTIASEYEDGAGFFMNMLVGRRHYTDAPDGCDATAYISTTMTGGGQVTEYTNKKVCWEHSSDGKNNKYCMFFNANGASVQYANEEKSNAAIRGCEVLPVKLYNYKKCMFCPLVGTVYDGVAKITDLSFGKMAGGFAVLLALGFAIWIAIQVLAQISSLTKQDAPKFLGGLIRQGYKVLIAFLLLQYSGQVFKYAVNPIVETGLIFGENMLTYNANVFSDAKNADGSYTRQARSVKGGAHFGLELYDKLEKYVVSIQQQIAFMEAIGTSLVCTGGNLMMFKGTFTEFPDGFQMFIQGSIIAIFAFLLSLAFGFYLLDAIVQIGVVGGLLPFIIAAWPFKATSTYTSTGVGMLMNSAFLFLFVGLIMGVNTTLLEEALGSANDINGWSLNQIGLAINGQDTNKLKELTDISAVGFMILLFCCIFGFKFVNQATPLANKFASGGIGKGIAPGIATMGASFAKSAGLNIASPVTSAVGKRADRAIKSATSTLISFPFRAARAGYRKLLSANGKTSGTGGSPQNIGNTQNKTSSTADSQNPSGSTAGARNVNRGNNTLNGGAASSRNVLNEGQLRNGQTATPRTLNEGRQNEPETAAEDVEDNSPAPEEFEARQPTGENTGSPRGAKAQTNQRQNGRVAATGNSSNARVQVRQNLDAALRAQKSNNIRNRKSKGGSRRKKRGGYKR